jgi:choline dehydrogenase
MENIYRYKEFESPTVMKNGVGAIKYLTEEIKNLNISKPLIVTDIGVVKAGIVEKVEENLKGNNIKYTIYDGVIANPSIEVVGKGTAVFKANNCDGLIAVGGGSAMDTAKSIGVEVVHGGSILEYEYGKTPLTKHITPLITIPTTAGTGSEVTLWAVITDPERKFKFNVGGPLIAPHISIVDPELHISMPPGVTAGTGMDALCHAIECYTSHYAQAITNAVALLAIEYVAKYLRRAVANGEDIEARYYMAMGAQLAGLSYGSESAGAVHAMAHTLGGIKTDIAHGDAVGVLLAPVMRYNWMGEPEKFKRIAEAMGEDVRGLNVREAALKGVDAVDRLAKDVNIPSLKELGVSEDELDFLAEEAEKDPQTIGNPRDINKKGYKEVYIDAYNNI